MSPGSLPGISQVKFSLAQPCGALPRPAKPRPALPNLAKTSHVPSMLPGERGAYRVAGPEQVGESDHNGDRGQSCCPNGPRCASIDT